MIKTLFQLLIDLLAFVVQLVLYYIFLGCVLCLLKRIGSSVLMIAAFECVRVDHP
jgi:hypothetical protein